MAGSINSGPALTGPRREPFRATCTTPCASAAIPAGQPGPEPRVDLATTPRITGLVRAVAELRGGPLDHLPIGPINLDPAAVVLVRYVLLPVVAPAGHPEEVGSVTSQSPLPIPMAGRCFVYHSRAVP